MPPLALVAFSRLAAMTDIGETLARAVAVAVGRMRQEKEQEEEERRCRSII